MHFHLISMTPDIIRHVEWEYDYDDDNDSEPSMAHGEIDIVGFSESIVLARSNAIARLRIVAQKMLDEAERMTREDYENAQSST